MQYFNTPQTQVTYNTTEDQYNYELNNIILNNPSIYITRLLERLFAGATGINWICNGLDVTVDPLSIGTNQLSFSITPGLMLIDSTLIKIDSTDTITSDIPVSFPPAISPSISTIPAHIPSAQVLIFANYTFSTAGATTVTYSSYVTSAMSSLPPIASAPPVFMAPALFAGTEKILLAVFDVDSNGTVWSAATRQNSRFIREVEVFTPAVDSPLENTITIGATTFAVRGNVNKFASRLAFQLASQSENVFILDSYLYKPFIPYLHWEVAGLFGF